MREVNGVNPSLRAREDEMRCPISISEARERGKFLHLQLFVLFRPTKVLDKAHPHMSALFTY